MLYGHSVTLLLANVANTTIVIVTLWSAGSRAVLVAWWVAVLAVTLARIELRRRYREARPSPSEAPTWGRRFVAASTLSGALWGVGGALVFDPHNVVSQILVPFAIGGMGAAAAGTISCYLPAFVGFALASLVPLAYRTAQEGDALHVAMTVMIGAFGFGMFWVARVTHASIVEGLRMRFENDALLARLSSAQTSLEETNRSLERRVAERTHELEEQSQALRDAQRMQTVGRLAGGIAHDFNNLLTVVLTNVEAIADSPTLDAASREATEDVRAAAQRGADLVKQLLAFSRRQRLEPKVLDLNEVVAGMDRLLRGVIGERATLELELDPRRLLVTADPTQIERIVVNLVTNARDAMTSGGAIRLRTTLAPLAEDPTLVAGEHVVLSVHDTGAGMPPETLERIFDPFFTTKEPGRGTGLGLATVHGIVEQSGGRVRVSSTVGKGTAFDVFLPRTSHEATLQPERARGRLEGGLRARVLVADDETGVRNVVARILRQAGHDVVTAENGEQALALARAAAPRFDVVVSDLAMPRMGGVEFVQRLSREQTDLGVLFMSGHGADDLLPESGEVRVVAYLGKPFTDDAILEKVDEVIALLEQRRGDRKSLV